MSISKAVLLSLLSIAGLATSAFGQSESVGYLPPTTFYTAGNPSASSFITNESPARLAASSLSSASSCSGGVALGRLDLGPQGLPSVDSSLAWLHSHASSLGYTGDDLKTLTPVWNYTEAGTGIFHLSLQQQLNGILVDSTGLEMSVMSNGRVMSVGGGLVSGLGKAGNNTAISSAPRPDIAPFQAISVAARSVGLPTIAETDVQALPLQSSIGSNSSLADSYTIPQYSAGTITPQLHYVPVGPGKVALAYNVSLSPADQPHSWQISVDASSGKTLRLSDNTQTYSGADYRVYAKPDPTSGPQILVSDGYDPVASPRGWQYWPEWPDSTTRPGRYQRTMGNNIYAECRKVPDDGSVYAVDPSSIVGDRLVYDYAYDTSLAPSDPANDPAATVNVFYWLNKAHDIYYRFGFDEAAANMQRVNLTGQGLGGDEIAVAIDSKQYDAAAWPCPEGQSNGSKVDIAYGMGGNATYPGPGHFAVDLSVIIHEYQHCVTERLMGSPTVVSSYGVNLNGMFKEGTADFFGLMVAQTSAHQPNVATLQSPWACPDPNLSRLYPYSYDMSINAETLGRYNTFNEQHDTGQLWCCVLWDLNKIFIDKYGYASDLGVGYDSTPGAQNAGNVLMFKLALLGTDILPDETSSMLEFRDALLTADQMLLNGADIADMWRAFARRGWGYSATFDGYTAHEAFDMPPGVPEPSTILLLTTGGMVLLLWSWRRRRCIVNVMEQGEK